MHKEAYDYVAKVFEHRSVGSVIEFGSLDINGSVRPIFEGTYYWGIDPQDGPGVDEVAYADQWRTDKPADVVVCCEVLEHTPELVPICRSAYRALEHRGRFVVTCATFPRTPHSAVDGGPLRSGEYYQNVPPFELLGALEGVGFHVIDLRVDDQRGDLYALAVKL